MSKKQINKNIANLDSDDIYSLMLVLLFASSDNPRYGAINELAYLLDHDSFLNFIKYYEGQTIEIPKLEDMQNALRTLMLYQYYKVEHMDWLEALKKAGFSVEDTHSAKRRLIKFIEHIEKYEYKLGGTI